MIITTNSYPLYHSQFFPIPPKKFAIIINSPHTTLHIDYVFLPINLITLCFPRHQHHRLRVYNVDDLGWAISIYNGTPTVNSLAYGHTSLPTSTIILAISLTSSFSGPPPSFLPKHSHLLSRTLPTPFPTFLLFPFYLLLLLCHSHHPSSVLYIYPF